MSTPPSWYIRKRIAEKKAAQDAKRQQKAAEEKKLTRHQPTHRTKGGGSDDKKQERKKPAAAKRADRKDQKTPLDDDQPFLWRGRRYGRWECTRCDHTWSSSFTWMKLLTDRTYICISRMECKECNTWVDEPKSHVRLRCPRCDEFLNKCTCRNDDTNDDEGDEDVEGDKHHIQDRCEMCRGKGKGKACSAGTGGGRTRHRKRSSS